MYFDTTTSTTGGLSTRHWTWALTTTTFTHLLSIPQPFPLFMTGDSLAFTKPRKTTRGEAKPHERGFLLGQELRKVQPPPHAPTRPWVRPQRSLLNAGLRHRRGEDTREQPGRVGGRGHSQVCQHGQLGVSPVQEKVDQSAEPVAGAGGGCHRAGRRRGWGWRRAPAGRHQLVALQLHWRHGGGGSSTPGGSGSAARGCRHSAGGAGTRPGSAHKENAGQRRAAAGNGPSGAQNSLGAGAAAMLGARDRKRTAAADRKENLSGRAEGSAEQGGGAERGGRGCVVAVAVAGAAVARRLRGLSCVGGEVALRGEGARGKTWSRLPTPEERGWLSPSCLGRAGEAWRLTEPCCGLSGQWEAAACVRVGAGSSLANNLGYARRS